MLFFGPALLQLAADVEQDLVARTDGVVEVGEGAGPVGLAIHYRLVGLLGLHGLLDTREVFLVLDVGLLDIVELLLAGLVGLEGGLVEEVLEFIGLLEDVEGHLEGAVLELDDEVDEELILVLADGELLSDLPEFLGHPVGHDRHVLQVVDVVLYVVDLVREQPR